MLQEWCKVLDAEKIQGLLLLVCIAMHGKKKEEITTSSLLSGFDHARVACLHAAKSCSGSYLEDNEHLASCTEVVGELATAL